MAFGFFKKKTDSVVSVVAPIDGQVVPIEVKSGNTRANSMNQILKQEKDIEYGYKFIDGNIGVSEEGCITLPLYMASLI